MNIFQAATKNAYVLNYEKPKKFITNRVLTVTTYNKFQLG